jgi:hypothetical protein
MDETVDIERYLSKKDSALGQAIKIVRAARGEPFRPPRSTDNPGTRPGGDLPTSVGSLGIDGVLPP